MSNLHLCTPPRSLPPSGSATCLPPTLLLRPPPPLLLHDPARPSHHQPAHRPRRGPPTTKARRLRRRLFRRLFTNISAQQTGVHPAPRSRLGLGAHGGPRAEVKIAFLPLSHPFFSLWSSSRFGVQQAPDRAHFSCAPLLLLRNGIGTWPFGPPSASLKYLILFFLFLLIRTVRKLMVNPHFLHRHSHATHPHIDSHYHTANPHPYLPLILPPHRTLEPSRAHITHVSYHVELKFGVVAQKLRPQ